MYTFGRDKEIANVVSRFGQTENSDLLLDVVNVIHDLLEGKAQLSEVAEKIDKAFKQGKSGIWETTGSWLLKLNKEFPSTSDIWSKFANDENATTRFRAASFLDNIENDLAKNLYEKFCVDKSKRVREHAEGKWSFRQNPEKYA